jgi:hypothetical protein
VKKLATWIKGIFEKDSSVSSKRIAGILMIVWSLSAASYFVYKSFNGDADQSSNSLIQFIIITGAGLLGTGTLVEGLGKNKKENKE